MKRQVTVTLESKEVRTFKKIAKKQNKLGKNMNAPLVNLSKFLNKKLIDYNNFYHYLIK